MKNIWRSHLFPLQWKLILQEKKKKSTTYHSYFSSWGINDCTFTSEYVFGWSIQRRYNGFVFNLTSHSYNNAMQIIYKWQKTFVQQNPCSPEMLHMLHNNRLAISYLEEHSKALPASCPTVFPLSQFTIYNSVYLHPVLLQNTGWQENLVILVNWNTAFSVLC